MSHPTKNDGNDIQWVVTPLLASSAAWSQATVYRESPFDGVSGMSMFPFPPLDFLIEPKGEWEKLQEHGAVAVSGQVYRQEDYVFVQPPQAYVTEVASKKNDAAESTIQQFWVGFIVEIRGDGKKIAYARVYWMYWPDELPMVKDCGVTAGGRRNYHGKHELIASNHMDIIDIRTFAGKASVTPWQETDEEKSLTGLYWRQTFNLSTRHLSPLTRYCVCSSYYNPDTILVACPNPTCALWLHTMCLTKTTPTQRSHHNLGLRPAAAVGEDSTVVAKTQQSRKILTLKSRADSAVGPIKEMFRAFSSSEEIRKSCQGLDDTPTAEVTDLHLVVEQEGRKWTEAVLCPKCAVRIE